jgi:hypothetical protein
MRTNQLLSTFITAAPLLLGAAWQTSAATADVHMVVVDYPKTVSAWSRYYVHVKFTNVSTQPVRGCLLDASSVRQHSPCIEVGYVFPDYPNASVPPVPLELVRALPPGIVLRPGESRDGIVTIIAAPRRFAGQPNAQLDLYLISRTQTDTLLRRASLITKVEGVPSLVWRDVGLVALLGGLYIAATLVVCWRAAAGWISGGRS